MTALSDMPSLPDASSSTLIWREGRDRETRARLEAFIAATYHRQHGATLHHFAPRLFGLWDGNDLLAAVGVRRADATPLFLESYLDAPIEAALAAAVGRPVARNTLAEIGNLSASRPGLTVPLIRRLIDTLVAEGCHWLAFTATATVRNGFRRLGLDVRLLAEADPERLGSAKDAWGNYYLHRPWVMGGDLLAAWHHLQAAERDPRALDAQTPTANVGS
ncbi:thermostable hemolysin [Salinicola avicenniae]|uniref:thermostable hemolysin n=1 Tax=Salinicola avicenniae TaxID=2916836 RepID=UPI002073FB98|nr:MULTISPECIES: thermostable hemolysin [unclassified Salinicola]